MNQHRHANYGHNRAAICPENGAYIFKFCVINVNIGAFSLSLSLFFSGLPQLCGNFSVQDLEIEAECPEKENTSLSNFNHS